MSWFVLGSEYYLDPDGILVRFLSGILTYLTGIGLEEVNWVSSSRCVDAPLPCGPPQGVVVFFSTLFSSDLRDVAFLWVLMKCHQCRAYLPNGRARFFNDGSH